VVPRNLPNELLDALPLLIMQVSDPFAGFVLELGQKSGHVLNSVAVLLGLAQTRRKRVNESLQTRQQTVDQLGGHLGLSQHFSQPRVESSIHDSFPPKIHP
jgi:hypothetical protein